MQTYYLAQFGSGAESADQPGRGEAPCKPSAGQGIAVAVAGDFLKSLLMQREMEVFNENSSVE